MTVILLACAVLGLGGVLTGCGDSYGAVVAQPTKLSEYAINKLNYTEVYAMVTSYKAKNVFDFELSIEGYDLSSSNNYYTAFVYGKRDGKDTLLMLDERAKDKVWDASEKFPFSYTELQDIVFQLQDSNGNALIKEDDHIFGMSALSGAGALKTDYPINLNFSSKKASGGFNNVYIHVRKDNASFYIKETSFDYSDTNVLYDSLEQGEWLHDSQ